MILQLEYQPRVHVIEWANEIAAKYPDDNIILTTHSYINADTADWCTQWMPYTKRDHEIGGYLCSLEGKSWPDGTTAPIWNNLIKNNANIKLLLCGHAGTGDGHVLTKLTKNAAGVTVPQVMINAQDLDVSYFQGEALAMLALLRFSADGQKVEIQYYSPYHDGTYHPSNEQMLSLTLDITGEATEQIKYPEEKDDQPEPTPEPEPDPEPNPDEQVQPGEELDSGNLVVVIVIAAAALLIVGGIIAVILAKKKKK